MFTGKRLDTPHLGGAADDVRMQLHMYVGQQAARGRALVRLLGRRIRFVDVLGAPIAGVSEQENRPA